MGAGAICPAGRGQDRVFGNNRNPGGVADPFQPRNFFSQFGLTAGGGISWIEFSLSWGGGVDAAPRLVERSGLDLSGNDTFCSRRPGGSFGGGRAGATPYRRGGGGENAGRSHLDSGGIAGAVAARDSADGWGGQLLVESPIEVCPDDRDGCFGSERGGLADSICRRGNDSGTGGTMAGTNPPVAPPAHL